MNAQEAREMSCANAQTYAKKQYDRCIFQIESASLRGELSTCIFEDINEETQNRLIQDGYDVSASIIVPSQTIISWRNGE